MITVPIREDLFEPIQQIARQERVTIEVLVDEWLTRQLALAREQKIKEEAVRFQEKIRISIRRFRLSKFTLDYPKRIQILGLSTPSLIRAQILPLYDACAPVEGNEIELQRIDD